MSLELWAGAECTVNRVGDAFFDQVHRTGHDARLGDLDLIASLGVKTVRYPILWERTEHNGQLNWAWPDQRLYRLRELKISPIAGLLHHGSGPAHTNLLDPAFPEKFCTYARAVAERYPWIENYIPINEPLTTARFSALYGHWFPHAASDHTFVRAFLAQCRATVLAMRAIREINPRARLIQTEDLGKTFSTNKLAAQARFENDRRWLTFDVLCGRLDHRHPLWNYFLSSGITDRELLWYVENPCRPDILGVNHYLTSERFLDHRTELYPAAAIGENGRERYADVEAVRVPIERDLGPGPRLSEIWQRYHLPLAVTEAHLGCSNDEQLRWFYQVWTAAQNLRADGADIRAVTAWALFGSFDWNSLLVRNDNIYEPGVFDIRHAQPRPTPLAQMLQELAAGATPSNPALNDAGWWMRPERVQYPGERFVVTEITDRASAPRLQTNL